MNAPTRHPLTLDGRDAANLRGDPITSDRYTSKEFMQREWDHLWTKIWHIAGRTNELEQPGDYIVHDFMHESVIIAKQDDGSLKGFYNSCAHRGLRLVSESSSTNGFHCRYHGWRYGKDGIVTEVPDAANFPQGSPCGKLRLKEVAVDTWGGFVWYTMNENPRPLAQYLEPFPELFRNYPLETLVRVFQIRIEINTNWKFAPDNFSESYHVRTAHPQIPYFIDQDYLVARVEMFPNGHGRTVQPFRPSLTDLLPEGQPHPYDDILKGWGIDPDRYPDFETKVMQGWLDLKEQKRKLWSERGFVHYEHMDDEQLTDSLHSTIFPNISITFNADEIFMMRTQPHPEDPGKCYFDVWCMSFPVRGASHTQTAMVGDSPLPLAEAPPIFRHYDDGKGVPEFEGGVLMQDLMLAEDMQRGLRSRGYNDAYLSASETRVRFFHELINDYLAGRKTA